MKKMKIAYKIFVRISEEKSPILRHRHGWENNAKMELKKYGCVSQDWISLAQARV
jgi:hypothetical protein